VKQDSSRTHHETKTRLLEEFFTEHTDRQTYTHEHRCAHHNTSQALPWAK